MPVYNDPFTKAAAFWNKFYPKLQETKGSQAFWDETISMGIHFNGETEQKIFVLLVDELEKRHRRK